MKRHLFTMLSLAALLFVAVGCSEKATEPSGSTTNLADEFGGYTTAAEAPGFGDNDILSQEDQETEVNDPMLSTPAVDSLVKDVESGFFHLRILWGQLRYDSTVTTLTDWSGSLTISRGAEVVRRIIRFERGQDELLPRTDRKLIEWNSFTTVHNDGIAVDLIIPRSRPTIDSSLVVDSLNDSTWVVDTVWPELVTVTFKTGPYTRTFELDEIAKLDTVVMLDDSNAVLFDGMQFFPNRCPRGFLSGHWGYDDEGNGIYRGMWTDQQGRITGWLKGHFGTNDDGKNVFFGKWISRSGRFEGFLRGSWEPRPDHNSDPNAVMHAGGFFWGRIFADNGRPIGYLKGRYESSNDFNGGFFQARWKLGCDKIRPDDPGMDRGNGGHDRGRDINDDPYDDGMGQ